MHDRLFKLGQRAIGALALLSLGAALIGGISPWIGGRGALEIVSRFNDGLAPVFILVALCGAVTLMLVHARVTGLVVALVAIIGAGATVTRHVQLSLPLVSAKDPALRVVFYNVLGTNRSTPEAITQALYDDDPDIAVFAEAAPVRTQLKALQKVYPHRIGCDPQCEVLVLSKLPFGTADARDLEPISRNRNAQFEVTLADGQPLTVVAVHMLKPWFDGRTQAERARLIKRLQSVTGPLVVMGDFNAAPWSYPMAEIFRDTDLAPARLSPGTWPAKLGRFGIPIDHMLVRDGARLSHLKAWGQGLGSNHRGLIAEIVLE